MSGLVNMDSFDKVDKQVYLLDQLNTVITELEKVGIFVSIEIKEKSECLITAPDAF